MLLLVAVSSRAADVDWSGWSFNYSTNNNLSGLVLTDVYYNDKKILGKASMPVMRVEYENDICGPYADILSPGALRNPGGGSQTPACENQAVCRRIFTQNGENFLEVGANWQIGEYQIYQTYYFSENGYIDSRVYSRGLQCQIQHSHHGQWMFDLDIDGASDDQIAKHANDIQVAEFNDLKANTSYWTVQDKNTGSKVQITPSDNDGEPDNFSKWDLAGRAFVASEVGAWRHGARGEIGNLFNTPTQSVDGADVVLWYVSHLPHSPQEGASFWHSSGPRLTVLDDTPSAPDSQPDSQPNPQPNPQPGPESDNTLVNGGFDSGGLAGWNNCGAATGVESVVSGQHDGVGAAKISNGGCLYQETTAEADATFELTCSANRTTGGWTIIELAYLDSDFENLFTDVKQIDQVTGFNQYTVSGQAPVGTAYAAALLYSESDTVFDSCVMQSIDSLTVPGVQPQPNPALTNLLANGNFESNLNSWNSCATSSLLAVSGDADTGNSAISVDNGGCAYQEFAVEPGNTYSMSCRAKSEADQLYTSVSLTLMDSNYAAIENAEVAVTTTTFGDYSAELIAPVNSRFGSVVVYSEDVGVFDNCVVSVE